MKFDILFYGQYNTISKILFSKIVYFQEQLNDVFYFFFNFVFNSKTYIKQVKFPYL